MPHGKLIIRPGGNTGGRMMVDEGERFINLEDAMVDEHTLHCVGAAVVAEWSNLPKNVREVILDTIDRVSAVNLRTPDNVKEKFLAILKHNNLEP
jgi:hypothetical protein